MNNRSAEALALAEYLLTEHHALGGAGPDDYCDGDTVHPMAEAKFLSALALVPRERLSLSFEEMADASLSRLASSGIGDNEQTGWGLGFAWGEHPEDIAYVITTSMVARATHDLQGASTGALSKGAQELKTRAVSWLLDSDLLTQVDGVSVPRYSISQDLVAYNVVAQWAAAISIAGTAFPEAARRGHEAATWVHKQRIVGAGWPYAANSKRYDLLHACYVASGLLDVLTDQDGLPREVTEAVVAFQARSQWLDKFDLDSRADFEDGLVPPKGRSVTKMGEHVLMKFAAPARAWSLGELLLVIAQLNQFPQERRYWRERTRSALGHASSLARVERRPRHSMHLAHGLAAVAACD